MQDTKKALREELQAVNKQRDGLRAKLRELKAKVGNYSTLQKIDEKIASLDYRITHHTLDLKEESRVCPLTVEQPGERFRKRIHRALAAILPTPFMFACRPEMR